MTHFVGLGRVLHHAPFVITLGLLSGCDALPQLGEQQPSLPQATPSKALPPTPLLPKAQEPAAKPVIFTLSVTDPLSELKIKPGMFIQKGQIIADKGNERLILSTQKKNVETQLTGLDGNRLVSINTEQEQKEIAIAQEQINLAEAALRNYQQDSPWTDFARDNLPLAEEEVKLNRLQSDLKFAQNKRASAEAKLAKKQEALQNFQKDQISQKNDLQQQLIQLEQKIAALKPILAPQSGTVQQVKLPNQATKGQPIKVTVTLIPGLTPKSNPALEGLPSTGNPPLTGAPPTSNPLSSPNPDILPSPDLNLPSQPNSGAGSPILPATE